MGLLDRLPGRDNDDPPPPAPSQPEDPDEEAFAELDEEFPLEEVAAEIEADERSASVVPDGVLLEPTPLPRQDLRDALAERDDPSPVAEEDAIWPRTRASRRLDP